MRSRHLSRAAGSVGALLLLVSVLLAAPTVAAASSTLYVSPAGSSGGADTSCTTAAYTKVGDAVAAAAAADTVVVCPGTYAEDVSIAKPLTLSASGAVTIDANGLDNGIKITASNVTVMGFTVENATGEGILAQQPLPVKGPLVGGQQLYTGTPISGVVISHNVVTGNDQGGLPANATTTQYAECKPSGQIPGDCGEGIHLWSVANSQVVFNEVSGNAGGILLTDEFGPTHDNLVAGNVVTDNLYDCGITLPSHNLGRDPQTGKFMPTFGGVYANVIRNNVIRDNGLFGGGAGVGMFAPFPGAASYNNIVQGNAIDGNGEGGVSLHGHAPGAYVGGNRIVDNFIGINNVNGDKDVTPGGDMQTTGIVAWSAATPITITISGNTIVGNHYGIWLGHVVSAPGAAQKNTIKGATTPVFKP